MTNIEKRAYLAKLANRINYLLDMNGGCTDEDILEMMHEYKLKKSELARSEKAAF